MNSNNHDGSHHLNPQTDHTSNSQPQQQRRPRGFAAAAMGVSTVTTTINSSPRGSRNEREKEKERTKLRERHRRAITSRMLAGLRQYGNFPLPARADMNDVLAALAREAGWTVEADGTTFRQTPPSSKLGVYPGRSVESPLSSSSLKSYSAKASMEFPSSVLRIDESPSPASLDSVVVPGRGTTECEKYGASPINSHDCLETDQLMQEGHIVEQGLNFLGTAYVPVYVMLGPGLINKFCHLIDRDAVRKELMILKSLHVDDVFVDCWWGIVEAQGPQKYCWSGYRELFNIIHEFELKLQVLYYLMRVEPFTTLSIRLQGGKFDHADRMFSDIGATWKGVVEDMSDVKELVPELFYFPEMLTNENSIDFGTTQLGDKLDSVKLPPWAENPVDFMHKHQMALESEHVSIHLHEWIDLIFG